MKELTTHDNKFTESEVKKENKFSGSRNFDFTCIYFNIYECLKWLEKPLWLINTKFGDITDMFNKYRSRSPKVLNLVILQICLINTEVGVQDGP